MSENADPTMTSSAPDTRTTIKEVFSRHLARLGYEGLSLEALAQEVGIRKASLYHHFPGGKETLYAAVVHDYIDEQAALFTAALDGDLDLEDRLTRIVAGLADPGGSATSFGQRIFDALESVKPDTRIELSEEYVGRLLKPVEELFAGEIERGRLAGADAGLMSTAFLHLARAVDMTAGDVEESARALARLFLLGAVPR